MLSHVVARPAGDGTPWGIPESALTHRNVGPEAGPIFAAVPRHVVLHVLYECMGRGNHTLIGMVMSDTHDFLLSKPA